MRNFVGGLLGSIIGSHTLVFLLGSTLSIPDFPNPFNFIWTILLGSTKLQVTLDGLFAGTTTGFYLLDWLIIGVIIALFSRRGWNTVRTAIWTGVFIAIFALTALLLENPSFWDVTLNPTRNYDLLVQFIVSISVSLFALMSAVPSTILIDRVLQPEEVKIPERIETRCVCGSVFKSNPLICSKCGSLLREIED